MYKTFIVIKRWKNNFNVIRSHLFDLRCVWHLHTWTSFFWSCCKFQPPLTIVPTLSKLCGSFNLKCHKYHINGYHKGYNLQFNDKCFKKPKTQFCMRPSFHALIFYILVYSAYIPTHILKIYWILTKLFTHLKKIKTITDRRT